MKKYKLFTFGGAGKTIAEAIVDVNLVYSQVIYGRVSDFLTAFQCEDGTHESKKRRHPFGIPSL